MKKFLLIALTALIAVSANAQLKRVDAVDPNIKLPSKEMKFAKHKLDPNPIRDTYNKSGVNFSGPKRIGYKDVFYARPAGAFPLAGLTVDNDPNYKGLVNFTTYSDGSPVPHWFIVKPYMDYTFQGYVIGAETLPALSVGWYIYQNYDEEGNEIEEELIGTDTYTTSQGYGGEETMPIFQAVFSDNYKDPDADYYIYQQTSYIYDTSKRPPLLVDQIPSVTTAMPSLKVAYPDYTFYWSQKPFHPGTRYGEEYYTMTLIGGLGLYGIDPNNNVADTVSEVLHGGSWFGKNSGYWETADSVNFFQTSRIDGVAQVFEKPEHPYLLNSVATDLMLLNLTDPVELTCKVYKLDEVPAYDDHTVRLPQTPGELIAVGHATLDPADADTVNEEIFAVFELMAQTEDGDEYEITPTVDYPIMIVFDDYNDPGKEGLADFTFAINYDIHSDEGHGETCYLLMDQCDDELQFHGDYMWYGVNNFFTSGEMKTCLNVYLNIDEPFLLTEVGGYFVNDTEYTFPDEGGPMYREIYLFEDQNEPFAVNGVNFWSWIRSNEGDWTLTWNGLDELPDWLDIELVDGEESYHTFSDGTTWRLGIDVEAHVTAQPLPEGVPYREATIRFEIPGEYIYYTFKQGEEPVPGNRFDVNGDGEVNVADVNFLIDMILASDLRPNGDVNQDGEVNVADVNFLVDYILNM